MKNSQTVVWASSEPFDVPAYATGEWGEYVASLAPLSFDPDIKNAAILSPQEQQEFVAQYAGPKRFRHAAEYMDLLDRADAARGF